MLWPLLKQVRATVPNVQTRFVEAMSGYLLEWLRAGRLDAAILFEEQDTTGAAMRHAGP
jgi:LysR family transcriptional regulator, nitrogen assimilation regulatory protein